MEVIITPEGDEYLQELFDFYTDLYSLSKAQDIVRQLLNRIEGLATMPFEGKEEPYLADLKLGHRFLLEVYVKIIYRIEQNTVYIVDFFDTRQDPKKLKRRIKS